MDSQNIHETAFIKTFIIKEKQERLLALIQNKKSRKRFRLLLAHNIEVNKKYVQILKTEEINIEYLRQLLKKYGSPNTCHIMCENSNYDDKEMTLNEALNEFINRDISFIMSCIPGKLAYFQGEGFAKKIILFNQES